MGKHVGSDPVDAGYVGIGWEQVGDLRLLESTRDAFKQAIIQNCPPRKPGAVPGNAGVLYRFIHEMKSGELVVYPSKEDRMVNIGRLVGDYNFVPDEANGYPNRRKIEWLGHFPRGDFRQSALYEIGSAITLFEVKRHVADFESRIDPSVLLEVATGGLEGDDDDDTITALVSNQAELTTQDFIVRQLYTGLDPYEFEEFVAHLLECMGYTARVTEKSGDGGVDVIAHTDKLGFQPPIIKVQCKKITGQTSEPEVSQLLGTLGEGEFALFFNLGSYTKPARTLERNRAKLRLIDGEQMVELVLEHYGDLAPRYRGLFPLRLIYVPDQTA